MYAIRSYYVGGGDVEVALIRVGVLPGHRLDALHLGQDLLGNLQDVPPRRGHLGQVLAAALEDLHPQLILQHAHLLADAGLGGIEALGGSGNVETVISHLDNVA